MRRSLLLLSSAAFPIALVGLVHGCSKERPVEDLCAFISHDNCYLDFHNNVKDACAPVSPVGAFQNRGTLDSCVLSQGGTVTFDPPLDVTMFPPTAGDAGMGFKMTFVTATGMDCGNVTYAGQYSFALTINTPDGGAMGSSSSGGGTDGGMMFGGTFSSATPEGGSLSDVTCPNGIETHHFDLLQVTGTNATDGCRAYADIIPQAILESSPGGVHAEGFVKLTIRFPPAAGVPANVMGTVAPDDIVYFNCTIPGAPLQCENGMKDGGETATDCGGPETSGNCPARCMAGQGCLNDCDCDAATSCQVDPMDGLKKCALGSKSGACKLICSDGVKDSNETDIDCGGGGCPPCPDGKTCLAGTDCQSGNCTGGVCTMPNCMDKAKNGAETGVDCGGATCPKCPDGQGCVSSADCANADCDANNICSACGNGKQDGGETDVDCGGGTCPKCIDGNVCAGASDCVSNRCAGNICVSCSDGAKNGTETDIDCGGSGVGACPKCGETKTCLVGSDCMYGVCNPMMICNSCADGMKDGAETDVDCGGNCGANCALGKGCTVNGDCASTKCIGGKCV